MLVAYGGNRLFVLSRISEVCECERKSLCELRYSKRSAREVVRHQNCQILCLRAFQIILMDMYSEIFMSSSIERRRDVTCDGYRLERTRLPGWEAWWGVLSEIVGKQCLIVEERRFIAIVAVSTQ